jgi:hypothetical protein
MTRHACHATRDVQQQHSSCLRIITMMSPTPLRSSPQPVTYLRREGVFEQQQQG